MNKLFCSCTGGTARRHALRAPCSRPSAASRTDKQADPRAVIAKKFPERQASTTCSPRRWPGSTRFRWARTWPTSAPTAATSSRAICTRSTRAPTSPSTSRAGDRTQAARQARRARHDRVLAAGREAHDHGVHRRRVRLLPQAPQPDRSAHQARRARALRGVSARRPGHGGLAQDGSGVVREGPQDGDHAGEARPGGEGARTAARRRSPSSSSSARTSACAARRRSSRRSGDYIGGYLPPADLVKQLEESEEAKVEPRRA